MSKLEIKVIDSDSIDQIKWSKMLLRTPELIAQYSEYWFLTTISDKWQAYVYGDYQSAFPCVYKTRYGIKIMYQPFFSRGFSLLGNQDQDLLNKIIMLVNERFSLIRFNSEEIIQDFGFQKTSMKYQLLSLNRSYEEIFDNYATNAKRILKKKPNVDIKETNNTLGFIELFKDKIGVKLGYKPSNYDSLGELIDQGLGNGTFKLFSLASHNKNYGYACFYFYRNTVNYIKGVLNDDGKNDGAMYVMFDYLIRTYAGTDKVLDFGGSNINGVATFYRKFGADNKTYYSYEKNQLPLLFRKLYDFRQKFVN